MGWGDDWHGLQFPAGHRGSGTGWCAPDKGPTRTYEDARIRVLWDAGRCVHVGRCLRALPAVFDLQARPWVDLDWASAEEVAAAVRTCPTGALRYQGLGGLSDEVRVALCRCGASQNKPFCDNSHRLIGFRG
jgi:uncharacterized Fe-S cluster protein YjdI